MSENWLPVVGYEGLYEVSDQGRVRSLTRRVNYRWGYQKTLPGKIKKLSVGTQYLQTSLSKNSKKEHKMIHRIVCDAFLGPLPEGMCTRHLDGNWSNNCLSNLAYGTYLENNLDRVSHGTMPMGEKGGTSKLTESDVIAIRASTQSQNQLARRFGVAQSSVWAIIHRKTWAHV